jgi:hypothetical protein
MGWEGEALSPSSVRTVARKNRKEQAPWYMKVKVPYIAMIFVCLIGVWEEAFQSH